MHYAGSSNYVKVKDIEGLKRSLSIFNFLDLFEKNGKWRIIQANYDEPIFSTILINETTDSDTYIEFDPQIHVIPYLEDNEILIFVCIGNDKLRSIWGESLAYHSNKSLRIDLDDIYKLIKTQWNIDNCETI